MQIMDFSKIDFTHDCYVDLHVGAYGSLSGMFFKSKAVLVTLEQLFKDSNNWQPSFEREDRQYLMGFVVPSNAQLIKFMQHQYVEEKEQAEKFYLENGFYEQTHDFLDVWFDNNVSDVQISFPLSEGHNYEIY